MDKACPFCGGTNFRQENVQYTYQHEFYELAVDNVPAEVCEFCHEQYFPEESSKMIQKAFQLKYFRMKKKKK